MSDYLQREYGFVYGIQSLDLIKVGVTMDINKRMTIMRLDNPHGCELVFYRRVYAPYTYEKKMHELLADKAVGREWFRTTLSDVRAAALTARLSSIKAKRAADRASLERFRETGTNSDTPKINNREINTIEA